MFSSIQFNPKSSSPSSIWSLKQLWLETTEHLKIAAPVCVTYVLRKSPDIISIMFVGHIASSLQDVSSLDGTKSVSHYVACVGLASVTANVTGNSMIIGMAGALSTICSQSYGAKDMHTFTTTLQKAILIELVCICAPVSLLWLFSEDLLLVLGQQPLISRDTSRYLVYLIPHLWASAVTYCLHNWLYAQSVTQPSAAIAVLTAIAHPLWCYVCIYIFRMGFLGAALAIVVTKVAELVFLVMYLNFFSNILAETGFQVQWPWPWSREIPGGVAGSIYNVRESWWSFLRLGLPNLMMMTEWWA
jgi:MATE family multidrug resistance protein